MISREIKRNKGLFSPYWHDWAQNCADERKSIPRYQKRKAHQPLYDVMMQNIQKGITPELISGRLAREYRITKMRVSPETIYQWIFTDSQAGGNIYLSLPRHHKRRTSHTC